MFKIIFGMILGAIFGTVGMIIIACLVLDGRIEDEKNRKEYDNTKSE